MHLSIAAANGKTLILHRHLRKAEALIFNGSHRLQRLAVSSENKTTKKNHLATITTFYLATISHHNLKSYVYI